MCCTRAATMGSPGSGHRTHTPSPPPRAIWASAGEPPHTLLLHLANSDGAKTTAMTLGAFLYLLNRELFIQTALRTRRPASRARHPRTPPGASPPPSRSPAGSPSTTLQVCAITSTPTMHLELDGVEDALLGRLLHLPRQKELVQDEVCLGVV